VKKAKSESQVANWPLTMSVRLVVFGLQGLKWK